MDGTEKLPQRILSPAAEALKAGQNIEPFAFAVAAWMRFALGVSDEIQTYGLRAPAEEQIASLLDGHRRAIEISVSEASTFGEADSRLI